MEKCSIDFINSEVEKNLIQEFNKVSKRRECIRPECKRFNKSLPSDIIVQQFDGELIDVDDKDIAKGKVKTVVAGGSIYFIGDSEKVNIKNKNIQKEAERVLNIVENSKCRHCDIINNFELYGEEICNRLGYSYIFFTFGEIDGAIVVTIMSSKGNLGRMNGEEVRTGIFKDLEPKSIKELVNYCYENIGETADVSIFLKYEHPKFTTKVTL